jgi:hypothetical protein
MSLSALARRAKAEATSGEIIERAVPAFRFAPCGLHAVRSGRMNLKNIQIIDGALNATFSIFQATDEECNRTEENGVRTVPIIRVSL